MGAPQTEKARKKYAWALVLVGGLLDVAGTLSYAAQNGWVLQYPSYLFGISVLSGGIIGIAIGPTVFRKGARWGWYLILLAGLFSLANGIYDMVVISPLVGVLLFLFYGGPTWLALGFTYPKFLPKNTVTTS